MNNEVVEKLFVIKKVDPLILFGPGDAFLKQIEQLIPVQLLGRGNEIKIVGEERDVKITEEILSELVFVANKNSNLTSRDVETVVHVARANQKEAEHLKVEKKEGSPSEKLDDVIVFTRRGYIKPRTPGQARVVQAIRKNDIAVVIGPAGTGKTYLAVALAVAALKSKEVDKIVLARPAVEAGESLGFLPGDLREKVDPYLRPLYDALDEMLPKDLLKKYMEQRVIEVIPLAYMRGRTLNNAFIILDEAQNSTAMQMKMCLTRMGVNSKAIINGDVTQIDLPASATSGLIQIQEILKGIEGIEFVYLDKRDVVRHKLVRNIIHAYDQHNNTKGE